MADNNQQNNPPQPPGPSSQRPPDIPPRRPSPFAIGALVDLVDPGPPPRYVLCNVRIQDRLYNSNADTWIFQFVNYEGQLYPDWAIEPVPADRDRTLMWVDEVLAARRHLEWRQFPPTSFTYAQDEAIARGEDVDRRGQLDDSEASTVILDDQGPNPADADQETVAADRPADPKNGGNAA